MQVQEPQDHALGRSQGGFGTKVHLVCDGHGIILAVWLTPGQQHESTVFEIVLLRANRRRPQRRRRWPQAVAGDKGYNYQHIRQWLQRHHIGAVIPTYKNQPRLEGFDATTYRKRNLIERVIGWFKECRALGSRYDKLAVNYTAQWIIASIQKLLQRYQKKLKFGLSDTA